MSGDNYVSSEKEITVPFSDDEQVRDEELITDEEVKLQLTNPEEAKRRNDKRRERAATRERERKQQEQELKALREASAKTERELAELRGYVAASAQRPTPQQQNGKDEFEARLDAIEEERTAAYAAAQAELKEGKLTAERAAYWDKKGRAIDERRAETIVERQLARARVGEEQRRQQEEGRQFWRHRHPEVYNDPRAYRWAEGRAAQFLAENNRSMTQDDIDAVMEETKVKFKLGKGRSAPSDTERARFTGVPSSGGGGADSKGASGIQMTKELKKMAEALYSDLPAEKAHQKWVNDVGKKLREKRVL